LFQLNNAGHILSYSLDEGHQNFMVGQWGNDLVFRLKADGRAKPIHFETDEILKKGERTSLAIIFDGSKLFAYQQGKKVKERTIGSLTFSGGINPTHWLLEARRTGNSRGKGVSIRWRYLTGH
jgi:hypothetical protein